MGKIIERFVQIITSFLAGIGAVNILAMFVGDAPLWLWLGMTLAGVVAVFFVELIRRVTHDPSTDAGY